MTEPNPLEYSERDDQGADWGKGTDRRPKRSRKPRSPEDTEGDDLMEAVKRAGGRMTVDEALAKPNNESSEN